MSWQDTENNVARPEPDHVPDVDEDAEYERDRQRGIDLSAELKRITRKMDEIMKESN